MPGAVWEYIKDFGAGFANSKSPYTMVRLVWKYKPKFSQGRTYFKKSGRISEYSNIYMNQLVSDHIGFETNVVRSTCAGEHAMTMKLAEILPLSTGFAVETQELLSLFEGYGGILPMINEDPIKKGIDIYQIETANPHMHEERGGDHVSEVLLHSLSALYHSKICSDELKRDIKKELVNRGIVKKRQQLDRPIILPPISTIDMKKFRKSIDLDRLYVH
jgi:mannosyl-3-phosphoglycerate synthase